MLNNVTTLLNKEFNNKEPTDAAQPSVQQVLDMYQSQPPTEEGWQEMTNDIKAAEEYETLQKLSTTINGLTVDEWNDLLCLS